MVTQYTFFESGGVCIDTQTKDGITRTSESGAVTIVIKITVGRMAQMVDKDQKSSLLGFGTYALCIGCQLTRLPSSAEQSVTRTVIVTEAMLILWKMIMSVLVWMRIWLGWERAPSITTKGFFHVRVRA
jgi:hypothetical protein